MTPVIFRKWKEGDIIALFPTLDYNEFSGLCWSYEHVGQHGGADYNHVVKITTPVRPEEYADLLAELKSIGYDDLKVYERRPQEMEPCRA